MWIFSQNVVWNNKDIRINNKPVCYKTYFDKGVTYLNDFQFNVDNVRSYESFKQKGLNTIFFYLDSVEIFYYKHEIKKLQLPPHIG